MKSSSRNMEKVTLKIKFLRIALLIKFTFSKYAFRNYNFKNVFIENTIFEFKAELSNSEHETRS